MEVQDAIWRVVEAKHQLETWLVLIGINASTWPSGEAMGNCVHALMEASRRISSVAYAVPHRPPASNGREQ